MSPRMGSSGGLGRCTGSTLPRLTIVLAWEKGLSGHVCLGSRTAPNPQGLPPCSQKLLAHPSAALLPQQSAWPPPPATPALACCPLQRLLCQLELAGSATAPLASCRGLYRLRQPGPRGLALGVQTAYCTGELLAWQFLALSVACGSLPSPIPTTIPQNSPEWKQVKVSFTEVF